MNCIKIGFSRISACYKTSLEFVSQETRFDAVKVPSEAVVEISKEGVAFSNAISSIFPQCLVIKPDKPSGYKSGIVQLQRRLWEVLMSILLIGESHAYFKIAEDYTNSDLSKKEVFLEKKQL